ncbi:MAG: apolipoprotein N-acyltransferase [Spirochaetaceae bacterium]|nr:apolipoprotein N-acyltransferase [Spirochaetaceae bacterium]
MVNNSHPVLKSSASGDDINSGGVNTGLGRGDNRAVFADFPVNLLLIILAAGLFALAHPNPLVKNGLSILAWIMYLPALFVIRRSTPLICLFWGALYGFTAFSLFNYWLVSYHLLAGIFTSTLYLFYFALVFFALRFALVLFPRYGFILQWLIFISFEYLRTLGFLGYSYGITGYTQWRTLPLIQIASLTGVWGVSALIIFPQTFAALYLLPRKSGARPFTFRVSGLTACISIYLIALISSLVYGTAAPHDFSKYESARIALIQHNTDPWKDEKSDYQNNFRILKRLSEEALSQNPKPDLVVWSETAFVPMIYWHSHYRTDSDYYAQVKELLDFLARQDVPFIIGNDDGRREMTENGYIDRVDYNAAILFEQGKMIDVYRKIHLVPFTEHFPYKKQLPFLYKLLEDLDTHFWQKGTRSLVFDTSNGLRFSTPICFEDTFGYLPRDFVKDGAELLVNLSNDAWSHSLSCQMQHLSMAVFRSVENSRSSARATASGQTCAIAPDGKILAMAEPFTEAALSVSVPILTRSTFYTRHGDFLPYIFIIAAIVMALAGIARRFKPDAI